MQHFTEQRHFMFYNVQINDGVVACTNWDNRCSCVDNILHRGKIWRECFALSSPGYFIMGMSMIIYIHSMLYDKFGAIHG
jgi:hypothetical protein